MISIHLIVIIEKIPTTPSYLGTVGIFLYICHERNVRNTYIMIDKKAKVHDDIVKNL